MSVQRFLPAENRVRRRVGWVLIVTGCALIAALAWSAIDWHRIDLLAVVYLAVPAALAAVGFWLAFRHPVAIDFDLDARRFTIMRNGSKSASGALDAFGPLSVNRGSHVEHHIFPHTVIHYVVSAALHPNIDLFVASTASRARRKMDRLGRVWRLPCRSFGGPVRSANVLGMPLHERMQNDAAAIVAIPLWPEWRVRIEPLAPGYALISRHRSWEPLWRSAIALVVVLFLLLVESRDLMVLMIRERDREMFTHYLWYSSPIVLFFVWRIVLGARDSLFPGTVRITERGVSYRGRSVGFHAIEEVTADLAIEVVGDRRILSLATSFCPKDALGAVSHELQRLIIEVGARSPRGV